MKNFILQNKILSKIYAFYLHFKYETYFSQKGWFLSFQLKMPVDKNKSPLPWITYPAIAFLESRISENMNVFEFGSGNSTIWWSSKVAKVVSCEHDQTWFDIIKKNIKENVTYTYQPLDNQAYETYIQSFNNEFDIIVVDGRNRNSCIKHSLSAIKKDGIIIWDNSDREKYSEGFAFLQNNSYKRIDFWGMGPIGINEWCTTIFYKEYNCLGI